MQGEKNRSADDESWMRAALAEAEPGRIQVIDANRPLENVQADIMSAVSAALKNANIR